MNRKIKICTSIMIIGLLSSAAYSFMINREIIGGRETLILATTTSLYDTGLLEELELKFEEKYDVDLRIISVGTGIALSFAERGDVDVLIIHDRVREDKFVEEGYGINRRCIAYNYFLIVGHENDPANIKDLSPEDAFTKIMEAKSSFVSRGDNSGTHVRERLIWKSAGYDYETIRKSGTWYVEAGSGMGATLTMANEKAAYTLVDIGTFLAYKYKLDLVSLVDEGDILLNVYAVIAVNPERHPHANIGMTNNFINFLMSNETQQMIGEYGVEKYKRPLFYPAANGKCEVIGCPTFEECAKPV